MCNMLDLVKFRFNDLKWSFCCILRCEKIAEATRNKLTLEAEAEAEAIRVKGEAEAFALQQKAKAEASTMAMKAEAWKEYKDAALMEMYLEVLPKVIFLV